MEARLVGAGNRLLLGGGVVCLCPEGFASLPPGRATGEGSTGFLLSEKPPGRKQADAVSAGATSARLRFEPSPASLPPGSDRAWPQPIEQEGAGAYSTKR